MEGQEIQTQPLATETQDQLVANDQAVEAAVQQLIDLDKADKFMFQGKEWTPDELSKATLMQSDYTKKTQELAAQRKAVEDQLKFEKNLEFDLKAVKADPRLATKFKEIYPKSYHAVVDLILNQARTTYVGEHDQPVEDEDESSSLLKPVLSEIEMIKAKLKEQEEMAHQKEVSFHEKQLDVTFSKLSSVYELADEDSVTRMAMNLMQDNKDNPNFKMSDSVWERLFKKDHEEKFKKAQLLLKKQVDSQLKASQRAGDTGPGGIPVGKPNKKLSFSEATDAAIQDLKSRLG